MRIRKRKKEKNDEQKKRRKKIETRMKWNMWSRNTSTLTLVPDMISCILANGELAQEKKNDVWECMKEKENCEREQNILENICAKQMPHLRSRSVLRVIIFLFILFLLLFFLLLLCLSSLFEMNLRSYESANNFSSFLFFFRYFDLLSISFHFEMDTPTITNSFSTYN